MNREIIILREAVVKLTQMLAGMGLRVTQIGMNAYVTTDPHTLKPVSVNIPHIPDNASRELIFAIQGFIDHEVAHVLFTDWEVIKTATLDSPELKILHNIVEDTFIERRMGQRFPGSVDNMKKLHEFFVERITKPTLDKIAGNMSDEFAVLLVPLIRALSGQDRFNEFLSKGGYYDHPAIAALLKALPDAVKRKIPNIANSAEALEVARVLKAIIHPPAPPSSGEGEGKKETSKGGKGKGEPQPDKDAKGEGKGKPEKTDKPKPGEGDSDEDATGGAGSEDDEEVGSDDDDDAEEGEDLADDAGDSGDEDESGGDDHPVHDEGEGDDGEESEEDASGDSEGSGSDVDDASDEGEAGDEGEGEEGEGKSASAGADDEGRGKPSSEDRVEEVPAESSFFSKFTPSEIADLEKLVTVKISEEARSAAIDSEYLIYTKDWDVLEVYPERNGYQDKWLADLDNQTRHMIGVMQKDIERMVAARSNSVMTSGHRTGRLHAGSLHRLRTGDDRVFARKQEAKSKDTAISLVVDNSGSMNGHKTRTAMTAAFALSQVLDRLGIAHEAIGFTTITGSRGDLGRGRPDPDFSRLASEQDRLGKRFSRVEPLYMPVFKTFSERLSPTAKRRFADVAYRQDFLANNVDGECVEIAGLRLLQRKEKRKIMIVLSDGAPAASPADMRHLSSHLKRVVRDLSLSGIDMVGIGINSEEVRHYYPRNMVLRNVEDLPKTVMGELKRILAT